MIRFWTIMLAWIIAGAGASVSAQTINGPTSQAPQTNSELPRPMPVIPFKQDATPLTAGDSAAVAWSLLLVFGVAAALLVFKRKSGVLVGRQSGWPSWGRALQDAQDAPKIISRTRMTPQHTACVVEWEGERLLVVCTQDGVQILATRTAATVDHKSGEQK